MKIRFYFVFLFSAVFLTACNNDSAPKIKQGQFIDSAVQGLRYTSGNQSGTTDANGQFSYEEGGDIQFYIGGIFLGKATGSSIVTPIDLVEDATDLSHPTVINITRFLQTLDDDGNPENGI